ncbi:ribosomal protein S18-alanine N-acetyltransferase [Entomobacter blattae]|uniref:[Ribosomal protein bS18]-alanine N-acetyltransferase n=1 Tax=Entomobacter blattae TaxID=2762277 RepID=A0A7H1NP05_9PROT|nr:ribosomal protein S18-alanine N-acetyltransferase [Entomobacter blattae]QNT77515.1 Acetyltransferase (GNAT) family protein [Entomobacter blattae]
MVRVVEEVSSFLGEIAALHARAFPKGQEWSLKEFENVFSLPGVFCLIEEPPHGFSSDSASLMGFLIGRTVLDEAEILTFAVGPLWQRQKIGQQILQETVHRLQQKGIQKFFLEVSVLNSHAIALYKKAGFERTGIRKCYYPDGSDAYIMVKLL